MKPMLAATVEDVESLRFPLIASPKLDGIRAFVKDGVLLSRNLKPIPNQHTQEKFRHLDGHDGELIVGEANAPDVYRVTMSGVMSHHGEPEVQFKVFDHYSCPNTPWMTRFQYTKEQYRLRHGFITSPRMLLEYEQQVLGEGYEGVMLRHPEGIYKHGRSTLSQGYLLKLKRFADSEGRVVDFEELMHNGNELTTNALGYAERSSHQANLVPMGRLGALVVEWNGLRFNIGTGFTDAEREEIWRNRPLHLLRLVKFKYLPIGVKEKPRHPVFLGWRSEDD